MDVLKQLSLCVCPEGFPGGSLSKEPAFSETQEMRVQPPPPGQEDPLEKERATRSSILPGKFHGQGRLAGYSPQGRKRRTRLSD